jgi:hypothetical protein
MGVEPASGTGTSTEANPSACALTEHFSSEDALWFKKESDTLWYKRIKLVHPDEKCLYTAEIKDQEEWEEEYHVTTRWMLSLSSGLCK